VVVDTKKLLNDVSVRRRFYDELLTEASAQNELEQLALEQLRKLAADAEPARR